MDEPQGGVEAAPVDEQQRAHAERLKRRIKYFGEQHKTHVKRWERNRKHVNGESGEDGESGLVRVNLIASVVNTIQPNIYAKAPEVSVQPEERVEQKSYEPTVRSFAKTLEMVLNRYAIRGAMLKARGKEAVRASLTCTTGWVKVIYQKEKREDPLVRNRINDAQDNILRVEQLLRQTEDEGKCAEYQASMSELKQQIAAMSEQVEVLVSEGLVIDNVQPEHILILDASIKTIDEYAQASAIAHGVYMTVGAYKATFGGKEPPKKATRYSDREDDSAERGKEGMDPDDALVLVWEIWSKDDLTVYTQCSGASEYCRPPYQPKTLGAQWYPFFPLQLWRVNGYLFARALVDNLIELNDEYNTRRTVAAEHRRKNMPVRLLNKASGITDEEIDTINSRGASTEVIGVTTDPTQPLANQLGTLPEIPYNRDMYDTTDILRDIEMVSGAQDASRGGVNTAKTATEAEIMAMGMQSRTSEQLDTIEDWLTAILSYCAQLLLQNLTPQMVQAKFGPDAIWPELSKKELFEQVMVQIRAGSTAKPNKMRERDQWLQFMPQMQEAVMQISELQQAGQQDLADSLMKLLDETLRRFDERMSIEEFVPGMEEEEDGRPNMQKMLQIAQQKIKEMSQEAEQALEQQRQDVAKRTEAVTQRETALSIEEIQFKATTDVAKIKQQFEDFTRKVNDERMAEKMQAEASAIDQQIRQAQEDQARRQADQAAKQAEQPEPDTQAMDAVLAGQQQIAEQLEQVMTVVSAPRETVLVRDEMGRPAKSISTPVVSSPERAT